MTEKITGNFLTQPNRDFPLDCETLANLQGLTDLAAIVGNAAGDRTVLTGCVLNEGTGQRSAGYVFLRTRRRPAGEVLYFAGGAAGDGMHVREEAVAVTANGVEYPRAYTRRWLEAGIGEESYPWEGFQEGVTLRTLAAGADALREALAGLRQPPLGVVEMWAGSTVPEGYALCDGRSLAAADYPELYGALGTAFNRAVSAAGVRYETEAGMFRLPDLRGRFVVGKHDSDDDYKQAGAGGGLKRVALTVDETPRHSHKVRDYYFAQAPSSMTAHKVTKFDNIPETETGNNGIGDHESDEDNTCMPYYEHASYETGGGGTHENRPPYYVLAYIMRVR